MARRPDFPYVNSPHRSRPLNPVGIVIHYTGGSYGSAVGWFQNPNSRVSSQTVHARDGRAVQMVPLPDPDPPVGPQDGRVKAWHCRKGNPRYIGIEHEGHGRPSDWTDPMLETSARWAAWCCDIYDIPVIGPPGGSGHRVWFEGFGGHYNVPTNTHTDPGPHFPWREYLSEVEALLRGGPTRPDDVIPMYEEVGMFRTTKRNGTWATSVTVPVPSWARRLVFATDHNADDPPSIRLAIGSGRDGWRGPIEDGLRVVPAIQHSRELPDYAEVVNVVHYDGYPIGYHFEP